MKEKRVKRKRVVVKCPVEDWDRCPYKISCVIFGVCPIDEDEG